MTQLGICDQLAVLMAYKEGRSQIALLPIIYLEWPELCTLYFFTYSPLLAPTLTATQKLVQLVAPSYHMSSACTELTLPKRFEYGIWPV